MNGLKICLVSVSLLCLATRASALVLSERGAPEQPAIVLRKAASEAERYAAEELRDHARKMTGVDLAIVTDDAPLPKRAILLGETRHTAAALGSDAVRPRREQDGFRLVARPPHLVVLGNAERGILYGVYELLERYGGCRWYSSWCAHVPSVDKVAVPDDLDVLSEPAFTSREPFWLDILLHPEFAARLRVNSRSWTTTGAKYGGMPYAFDNQLLAAHTFARLVPEEKYGKDHPEYFSMLNGVRRPKASQLCLSNPDVLSIVVSNVLGRIKANPKAKFYGVSQNDRTDWCQCPACRATDDAEGSPAGSIVKFVNAVAEGVGREHPDKLVETLAYRYSRHAPKNLHLRPNAAVCLCTLECDFSRALDKCPYAENVAFLKDIADWSKRTDNLYIWDYVANMVDVRVIHANTYALRENLRFFRKTGVKYMFTQGAHMSYHGDFAELKTWLLAKWMWNPDLPAEPLIDEFMKGYYGAAAPWVRKYFDEMHRLQRTYSERTGNPLLQWCSSVNDTLTMTRAYPDDFFPRAEEWWRRAEAAVADDAERAYNVRMSASCFRHTYLKRLRVLADNDFYLAGTDPHAAFRPKMQELARAEIDDCELAARKGRPLYAWYERDREKILSPWRRLVRGAFARVATNVTYVIEDSLLPVPWELGVWAKRVDDPAAGDGRATELVNAFRDWCVQLSLSRIAFRPGVRYRFRVRVRAESASAAKDPVVFSCGIQDDRDAKNSRSVNVRLSQLRGGYTWIEIGRFVPVSHQVLWMAAGAAKSVLPDVGSAFVDCLEISEDEPPVPTDGGAGALEAGFRNPPREAKPQTWYHMMNGNVTKEGITKDFEALAKAGIGGVQMFDAGCGIPAGSVAFGSEAWYDLLKHAASEARRLGLEICMPNCSGWSSSGGPWNTPEYGMQDIVHAQQIVRGPCTYARKLPDPPNPHGHYRDVAVIAFPKPAWETDAASAVVISNLPPLMLAKKAGSSALATAHPERTIAKSGIVDLTRQLDDQGVLRWKVPAGEWCVLRFGFAASGKCNHPASVKGRGLEVDKLSAKAVRRHIDQYVAKLCQRLGPLAGSVETGFNNILIDSYEVGPQNWTPGLEKTFEERFGYSLLPYVPVFTGRLVGSAAETERFLWDFRRLLADLFAENYAGAMAKRCHELGLMLSIEPYGSPGDNLAYGRYADIPMGEIWSSAPESNNPAWSAYYARFASFLAHVWGRKYVGVEAFTGNAKDAGKWLTTPKDLKRRCDAGYAAGANRMIYHRFVHQPWTDRPRVPGMTMGPWGMHFDRTQTWWPYVGGWLRYQARCQYLLQQGTFVADALFFCGENAPNNGGDSWYGKEEWDRFPSGYKMDVCSCDALAELKVRDGRLVVPGGVTYRMLVLPKDVGRMTLPTLKRIAALVEAGATVVSRGIPVRSPGLAGYPQCDEAVRALSAKAWEKGVLRCAATDALTRLRVEPDFIDLGKTNEVLWTHRRLDGGDDIYFVATMKCREIVATCSFRTTGSIPEIWDAETGDIALAPAWRREGARTVVEVPLSDRGSKFVVFRSHSPRGRTPPVRPRIAAKRIPVTGAWQVRFPNGFLPPVLAKGKPERVSFPKLVSWTDRPESAIRHFSGTAEYRKILDIPPSSNERLALDLGEVKELAEVTVNGKRLPVLWKPPYRLDITEAVDHSGKADVRIRVTNLWPNFLIGEEEKPEDCEWNGDALKCIPDWVAAGKDSPTGRRTFTTWKHWHKGDSLLPSGLLGPVSLIRERTEP